VSDVNKGRLDELMAEMDVMRRWMIVRIILGAALFICITSIFALNIYWVIAPYAINLQLVVPTSVGLAIIALMVKREIGIREEAMLSWLDKTKEVK
jgi:hypothetical protein